ncbi:MAG: hypothetical protein L6R37_001551 [Teloschistes peruensis]|nr:MAG: hypothetical protein L6R37_001551 [Teloschistes peruensis]
MGVFLTLSFDSPFPIQIIAGIADQVIYVRNKFCSSFDTRCLKEAYRLSEATYLDIDYDSISRNLVVTSFHHESPEPQPWDERIQLDESSAKIEVGVLGSEKAESPNELFLEGFLTVVGESEKPTPVCALYTFLTLPSLLFVDKYQLSSPNFLASKNLRALRNVSGETDLEAPDWVVQKWGSTLLLELAPPPTLDSTKAKKKDKAWHADVPLHLRYLLPTSGGIANVQVPWPVVFWACPAREETKLDGNPFDRVDLGYDSFFDQQVVFHHLQPRPVDPGASMVEGLQVPVMDLEKTLWVESGTVGVMVLGAVWIIWKLLNIILGDCMSGAEEVQAKKKQ